MKLAVLADLHANLAATTAVLDAVAAARPDALVVLGDLVGYHAEPDEVVTRVAALGAAVVAGNHDRDVLTQKPAPGTGGDPRRVQAWTAGRLGADARAFLAGLPAIHHGDGYVAVHGSYLSDIHVTGYVTSTMLEANLRAILARPGWARVAFCGHSHVPMIGWLESDVLAEPRWNAANDTITWPAAADVVLLNPGAVGQPRDGDPRAAFAIVDLAARRATLHRVAYDIAATARAVRAAGLPEELAVRLSEGR